MRFSKPLTGASLLLCFALSGAALADPTLWKPHQFSPKIPVGRTQLIDVNQDGYLDLVVDGPGDRLEIFLHRTSSDQDKSASLWADQPLQCPELSDGIPASFAVWGDFLGNGQIQAVTVVRQTAEQFAAKPAQQRLLYWNAEENCLRSEVLSALNRDQQHNTVCAACGDLDLDGHLDLGLGQSYLNEAKSLDSEAWLFYAGRGSNLDWLEVTHRWGLAQSGQVGAAQAARPLFGLTFSDLNNDGYPEILGAAYGRQWNLLRMRSPESAKDPASRVDTIPSDQTRYDEVAAKFGLDGDEIRHGRYGAETREMFRKRGQSKPDELAHRSNGNSFSLASADFDGDGDIDIFSSEITHSWAGDSSDLSSLLINQLEQFGEPRLERCLELCSPLDPQTGFGVRPTKGLGRDHRPQTSARWNQGDLQAHWADLNQDGLLDLVVCESDYPGNRLRVWLQDADHNFLESELSMGLDFVNCPGVSVGDVDRDGDLDLIATGTRTRWPEARSAPELVWWENPTNQSGNESLTIRLLGNGTSANRSAIGARVFLERPSSKQGKPGWQVMQSREVLGAYGHWAQQTQPGEVHFGLGRRCPELVKAGCRLRVVWPDRELSETLVELHQAGWLEIDQAQGVVSQTAKFREPSFKGPTSDLKHF